MIMHSRPTTGTGAQERAAATRILWHRAVKRDVGQNWSSLRLRKLLCGMKSANPTYRPRFGATGQTQSARGSAGGPIQDAGGLLFRRAKPLGVLISLFKLASSFCLAADPSVQPEKEANE